MTAHINGSKGKELYYNGTKIKEAYYNGNKVYGKVALFFCYRVRNNSSYMYLYFQQELQAGYAVTSQNVYNTSDVHQATYANELVNGYANAWTTVQRMSGDDAYVGTVFEFEELFYRYTSGDLYN